MRSALGVAFALALAGCGSGSAPTADSQIAVKVNKGEISVHQVQAVLKRQPRLLAEQPDTAAARVLEALIDQEVAAQAAIEKGLDHDPDVVQALQLARREVLARAYQEQLSAAATGPSSDEVDRYYESRPALFAKRRLYTLQEFVVEPDAAKATALPELARRAKGADELEALLRDGGYRYRTRRFTQAAEDLPPVLLDPLAQLDKGQSLWVAQSAVPRFYTVLEVQNAPVDRRTAGDAITSHLFNERKRQRIAPALKSLRDTAELHYQGGFAKPATAASAAAASSAP